MQYIKVRVGDIFDIHPTKTYKRTNANLFNEKGNVPVVANNSINNGIGGYSKLAATEKGGIITFSDTTSTDSMFYQPNDFIGYSHVQGMYPKSDKWTANSLKYFLVHFKKHAQAIGFSYANKFNRKIASEFIVSLPSKDGKNIDFKFMENYIEKMENEYYSKALKYLETEMKKDSDITKIDEIIISEKKEFAKFRFDDILKKIKVNKLNYKVKSLPSKPIGEYTLPALTAGIDNQGLACYVPYDGATVLKNCISVSANGANTGKMFYQPKNFPVLQDSYALKPISGGVSSYAQMYIICAMQHVIKDNYNWSNKAGWEKIRGHIVMLPINKNKTPDYKYMDAYMRVKEKQVLKKLLKHYPTKEKASFI